MKCIIIEDEPMATIALKKLCERDNRLELIDSFENATSALEFLKENEIDLLFLDIDMPEMTGIELIDVLPYMPQIVFTTGSKEYAFEAYEYDVTDFLIKPINEKRFQRAVDKVLERAERQFLTREESAQKEIYIKSEGRLLRVAYDQIYFFENVGDYIKCVSALGSHVFHGTIKALDTHIKHPRFLKVHRSYIINMDFIIDIEDSTIVIQDRVVPVSRAHRPILLKMINIH